MGKQSTHESKREPPTSETAVSCGLARQGAYITSAASLKSRVGGSGFAHDMIVVRNRAKRCEFNNLLNVLRRVGGMINITVGILAQGQSTIGNAQK